MSTPRISASSYSNTAPLIWSFLYGSNHGRAELVLDNAPARSAQLLGEGRADAALVPVIAYHQLGGARLVPEVCVGAKEKARSVCLFTRGKSLDDVRSVALDASSRTSVVLTKIVFREFLGFEPEWRGAEPNVDAMLETSDGALLIGDPALKLSAGNAAASDLRFFDLAELWKRCTGLGFVFAMWMTGSERSPVDFVSARDEGLARLDDIVTNYQADLGIGSDELRTYLSQNISYSLDEELRLGMELYFELAKKHGLCENIRELRYTR